MAAGMMDVLVVEDDPRIARVVERALTDVGHRVEVAHDGLEGLTSAERGSHDLVVLDVMLPEMDGIEVARELRRQRLRTPILMLTARDAVPDRVRGLDAGADDYLTKPFALEELLARVRAVGRRGADGLDGDVLRVADLTVAESPRTILVGGGDLERERYRGGVFYLVVGPDGQVLANPQHVDASGIDLAGLVGVGRRAETAEVGGEPARLYA